MKPLDKIIVTQKFGDNQAYYAQFGLRGHEGIDLKTKFIGNSWGFWYDYKGWRSVYAVKDGICRVKYDKSGYGTHITLQDTVDNLYLYGHLKNSKVQDGQYVKEGEVIAISGNTGNTTGPHLHFAYKPKNPFYQNGFNGWENPWFLLQPNFKIAFVGPNLGQSDEFIKKMGEYLPEAKFEAVWYNFVPSVNLGILSGDQSISIIDRLDIKEKYVYLFYYRNITSTFEVAHFYPAKKVAFCTVPTPCNLTILVHAFLHLFRKTINFNKFGPYIEDWEYYPTSWSNAADFNEPGWRFWEQYSQLKPYLPYF